MLLGQDRSRLDGDLGLGADVDGPIGGVLRLLQDQHGVIQFAQFAQDDDLPQKSVDDAGEMADPAGAARGALVVLLGADRIVVGSGQVTQQDGGFDILECVGVLAARFELPIEQLAGALGVAAIEIDAGQPRQRASLAGHIGDALRRMQRLAQMELLVLGIPEVSEQVGRAQVAVDEQAVESFVPRRENGETNQEERAFGVIGSEQFSFAVELPHFAVGKPVEQ